VDIESERVTETMGEEGEGDAGLKYRLGITAEDA
jgi:hypothetical protein